MMYRKVAGEAGLLIYIFVRWQKNYPDYYTKQKSDWVKLSDVKMEQEGFGMDTKTKNKAIRKLEKAEHPHAHASSDATVDSGYRREQHQAEPGRNRDGQESTQKPCSD